jgi:diguanylate cyclase (GGDEF)-like protein
MSNLQLLRSTEIFSTLLDDDLKFLLTRIKEQSFSKGEVIFSRGSAAIHFYIVKSGEVVIIQQPENGKNYDIAKYISGDSFGEFVYITGSLHDVEARALKNCRLLIFPHFPDTLDNLSLEKPHTISRLYLSFLSFLSSRLRAVHNLISENTIWVKHLQEQTYVDQLTGLYTKLFLDSEIPRLLQQPAAIIIIKPDRFKELNDTFGHKAGDAILGKIGNDLQNVLKNKYEGWALRLQSNELCVICQKTEKTGAIEIAKQIAKNILKIGPSWNKKTDKTKRGLTSSIGIGIYNQNNFNNIFNDTYTLMQKAWKKGGNRICIHKSI